MKKSINYIILLVLSFMLVIPQSSYAGNKDRAGQAGASELLINPWARSSGWGGVDVSCSRGLEALYTNVAGIAFTKKTNIIFSNTNWLKGAGININTFGFSQRVSESSVLGFSVMSMNFGEITKTDEMQPDGGFGTFSPKNMNINVAFAKMFSNSIYGGFNLKIISESVSNASAQGVAIDVGIQYVTGLDGKENIKFGISLKNQGPPLIFSGDGLRFSGLAPEASSESSQMHLSEKFELPSSLNMGFAYDLDITEIHKATLAASFVSNSFIKDLVIFGIEYNFNKYLYLRAAYTWEEGVGDIETSTSAYSGPSGGFSVDVPFDKEKTKNFSFDYAYRMSLGYFGGSHTVGARISL